MADNLFEWIDALWTKAHPEGRPPIYMMHRFLASNRDFAIAARCLQIDLYRAEPEIAFRVWQGLLPKGRGAPRLQYVARKKPPAAEELTTKMIQVLGESRRVVEEMQTILELAHRGWGLYIYFGVTPPETEEPKEEATPRGPAGGGLLSHV